MKKKVDIAVATDPVKDPYDIIEYAKELQEKVELLHCDVMDGKFVSKKSLDAGFINLINSQTALPLDVHMMVSEPKNVIDDYIDAGANIVTLHFEAFKDKKQLLAALSHIRKKSALAGISFKPSTSLRDVKSFLFYVDVVLLMGVEPGASGQPMKEATFDRLKKIAKFRADNKLAFKIEVDGGVNEDNAHLLAELGADILVSGSFVYNSSDKEKAIKKLRK